MSLVVTVLVVFVILAILYFIINKVTGNAVKLSAIRKANQKRFPGKKLKNNNSQNFTFSVWFYVDDWSVNYGKKKPLITVDSANGRPLDVTMGAEVNNLDITASCYATKSGGGRGGVNTVNKTCTVQNFPLQKWVNLILSAYGRTLDIYIDGKLVRTCVLPGPIAMNNIKDVVLTAGSPSFQGMTADLTYWPSASNPQQAYNIYASGFGGMGSNFFNKYKIRVSFLEDGNVDYSFEI